MLHFALDNRIEKKEGGGATTVKTGEMFELAKCELARENVGEFDFFCKRETAKSALGNL